MGLAKSDLRKFAAHAHRIMTIGRLRSSLRMLVCITATLAACDHPPEPSVEAKRFLKPTRSIREIFEDQQGRMWFNSPSWTCCYDPNTRDAENGGFTYYTEAELGVVVGSFQEDAEGRVWMQNASGIHQYDGQSFTHIEARDYDHPHAWASAPGDVWFGHDAGLSHGDDESKWGVYRFHEGAFTFLAFPELPKEERADFFPLMAPAAQAKDGTIWFGTYGAAFGFDGESFDIISRTRFGQAEDVRPVALLDLHMDSQDRLWIAAKGNGVLVYDGNEVVNFTALHGLTYAGRRKPYLEEVCSIAEDADGNFWIGTSSSGVWRYEPSKEDPVHTGRFTTFGEEQGWPCRVASSIFKTRNGELLFAGEDPGGVYRFNGTGFERVY